MPDAFFSTTLLRGAQRDRDSNVHGDDRLSPAVPNSSIPARRNQRSSEDQKPCGGRLRDNGNRERFHTDPARGGLDRIHRSVTEPDDYIREQVRHIERIGSWRLWEVGDTRGEDDGGARDVLDHGADRVSRSARYRDK